MTRAPGNLFTKRTIEPATVQAALDHIDVTYRSNAWTAVLGGVTLCLIPPLLLTLMYLVLAHGTIGGWGFQVTYLIMAVLGLPALFLLALRVQRPFPGPTTPASEQIRVRRDDADEDSSNDDTVVLARRAAVWGEWANVGPRLVLWGAGRVRAPSAFGTVPHARVVAALITLAEAGGAVSPAKLLQPGESADALEPLLGVLLYHELADLSKRADRVWITTEAKRKLGIPV